MKIKIDRERLYSLYMQEVELIVEACDWKTHFTPDEIVQIICNILENDEKSIKPETDE